MKMKTKIAAVVAALTLQIGGHVSAASLEDELAALAMEPVSEEVNETFVPEEFAKNSKSKKELQAERKAARKQIEQERKKSRAEINGKAPVTKNPALPNVPARNNLEVADLSDEELIQPEPLQQTVNTLEPDKAKSSEKKSTKKKSAKKSARKNLATNKDTVEPAAKKLSRKNSEPTIKESAILPTQKLSDKVSPASTDAGVPNPIVTYNDFSKVTQAVHFTPLYIPKKSGYVINSMAVIDNRTAEISYGRRWEPNVSLQIRTYKRELGEDLKDISGIHGVKWRVNVVEDITIYIAKIDEDRHVAAWAVGDYTFSAYVENLSFAAFHSLVSDELVDLSTHYYLAGS